MKVRSVVTFMKQVLLNERDYRNIESSFEIPEKLKLLLYSSGFWNDIASDANIFDPISICIVFLELETCSMADFYAVFHFVRPHLREVAGIINAESL